MIRHAHQTSPQHDGGGVLRTTRRPVMKAARLSNLWQNGLQGAMGQVAGQLSRKRYAACADEGGNAQPPHGHLAVSRRPPARAARFATRALPGAAPGHGGPDGLLPFQAVGGASDLPGGKPGHIASPLQIMIDGPLGGAAFNNEFGRPNLAGYFREYRAAGWPVWRAAHH